MKKIIFIILFLFVYLNIFATHNRAGEITYRQISGLTFEVTIITYTATGPGLCADRPELDIMWGDNTISTLPRVEEIQLPDYYKRNKYLGVHTYMGPGLYSLVVEDPNRNLGVANIPNSVNTVFSISTTMYVNPEIGTNNTPVLTRAPLDKAAVGRLFVHNPGAFDVDGDSLAYRLTICRSDNGLPISGYTYPPASDTLYVDAYTGDFVWKNPTTVGVYNVAMIIEEWRKGVKIDEIIRDMQIQVFDDNNHPPEISAHDNICVEAGTQIRDTIVATDKDNNSITLSAVGAPFLLDPDNSGFSIIASALGLKKGLLIWNTSCANIRKQPYSVFIKATDNSEPVNLTFIKTINITIVGPAVENPIINSASNFISLGWDKNRCNNAIGYTIYRKITSAFFQHGDCQIGIPESLGYTKIAFVEGVNNNSYQDFDVAQGFDYCYRICTVWDDKGEQLEGYASDEICITLKRGIPTITNVSVENTDENDGIIYVAWAKPKVEEIDSTATGPYQYVLYRSIGYVGQNLVEIKQLNDINDTIFIDSLLNTSNNVYSYKVEFYNNAVGNRFLIGTPDVASSLWLDIQLLENKNSLYFSKNVPWQNNLYSFYKYDNTNYNFIGSISNEVHFDDTHIVSGEKNCYYVESSGFYSSSEIINPILNKSQIKCVVNIDTFPPCPPILQVTSICDSAYNSVSWALSDTCTQDVVSYNLYYKPRINSDFTKITSTDKNEFKHIPIISLAGCYYVNTVDFYGNMSENSNVVCVDNCTYYRLPNVFSPNGDGINDFYEPIKPYYFVEKIDMKIFNRWGDLIFETSDPDIRWDGKYSHNKKPVADGVYFYRCDVYEQRLTGIEIRHLEGFIHVFASNDYKNTISE
ncbi:MAG: gliding motility-associated C-terminal domain-containing protein [Bacteroidales bacterium]|jgi:gliding motility-associated-like protein|nr:gliding motility-associated C-terminal domain-containing protein [Bacteroidales bacterium]